MALRDDVNEDAMGEAIDILLVEPNPGDTRLFTENFREAKLLNTIHAVPEGETALDFVHQRGDHANAPRPDIILLEPQLPGTSGMDVLGELQDEPALSDIPVIVLTSSEMGEEIVKSHDLEADAYIRKPVETDEFIAFVQEVEEFWFAIVKSESQSESSGDEASDAAAETGSEREAEPKAEIEAEPETDTD